MRYNDALNYNELWRKLRNDNNPLADNIGQILDQDNEELAQAQLATGQCVQELRDAEDIAEDMRSALERADSVIDDKIEEIDALKASLALSNRIGQALLKHRRKRA